MPLSASQLKTQVLTEVQDDGTIAPILNLLWTKHDSRDLWPQYLHVRLDAVDILIAKYREMIRTAGDGRSMHLNEVFDHLVVMRTIYAQELTDYSGVDASPSVDEMETVTTVPGLAGYPDPNATIWQGSPVGRQLRGIYGGWP